MTTQALSHEDADTAVADVPQETPQNNGRRKQLFLGLALGVLVLGGGYKAYDVLVASRHAETDNAYVGADVAQVTPLLDATVSQVLVSDSQSVKQGDVLVKLDDTDARIALDGAEAQLALTERRVKGLSATDLGLGAQVAARAADEARAQAQLVSAKADLDRAAIDLKRREALAASGSVSGEELSSARNAFASAGANLRAAQAAIAQAGASRQAAIGTQSANKVLIEHTTVENNPEVVAARANRDQARVNLARMVIRAPVDGVISGRQAQVGERAKAGQVLMRVVPVSAAYVDANFKEVQLTKVHPGQKVHLTADLYGGKVAYHGTVVGFSGGTGSAFAVVPAQNATGNWIKVVQRLPVRIALDPKELVEHPLRVGLSMNADIDVSK